MLNVENIFQPMLQVLMVSVRMGALWMVFPVFSSRTIPAFVKLAGVLALSFAMIPKVHSFLPAWSITKMPDMYQLFIFTARELLVGLGMGLSVRWIFSSCVAAAHWVGTQMGFSMGSIMSHETGGSESAWSELHQWICLILFLGAGGHWLLIQALWDSYQVDLSMFFTKLSNPEIAAVLWVDVGTRFFAWMLKLSGPMIVVLLLLQGALGVLSRFVPQINVWLVSVPLTLGLGVFVFMLLSPAYSDALGSLFTASHESGAIFLKALGGR